MAMSYLSPHLFWLALLLPLQVAAYLWLLQRRKRLAVRLSHVGAVKDALGPSNGWRRHVPPLLLLAAFAVMVLALARPTAPVVLPAMYQTIMLAIDVSGSMQAPDVSPSRIRASQHAAKSFVKRLPRDVRVGLVAYADTAHLVQPPTAQREEVLAAIDRLQLQGGTAIGEGIVVSLAALFPDRDLEFNDLGMTRRIPASRHGVAHQSAAGWQSFRPVPPGSDRSAVIVLLTDGQNTMGPDPVEAAQIAASRGIKVYTVGFGTKNGEVMGPEGWSVRVQLDENTLKRVAELTRGQYFRASNGTELAKVYEGLQGRLVMERQDTEVTALFAGAAALLLIAGAGLSMLWFGRVG
jgi:Ca-activated chloride channel homolog